MGTSIKYCIVPQRKNTATKTPEKLFFTFVNQIKMDKCDEKSTSIRTKNDNIFL